MPAERTAASILQDATLDFALVFAVGFALGIPRTLWLEPALGTRWAELLEMPLMAVAMVAVARWLVRRHAQTATRPRTHRAWLAVGLLALAELVCAEVLLGLTLRGATLTEIVLDRDPVSGSVYLAMLLVFGGLPAWIARRA